MAKKIQKQSDLQREANVIPPMYQGSSEPALRLDDFDISGIFKPVIVVGRVDSSVGLGIMAQSVLFGLSGGLRYLFMNVEATMDEVMAMGAVDPGAVVYAELPRSGYATRVLPRLLPDVPHVLRLAWDSTVLNDEHLDFINSGITAIWSIAPPALTETWRTQIPEQVTLSSLPLCLDLAPFWNTRFASNGGRSSAQAPKIRVLSIGAFHPRKNHAALIRATARLRESGIDVHLRLHSSLSFGEGYEYIKRLAHEELGGACVVTHETLTASEYAQLFRSSDVYCSASAGEGCNIPLRQAYAMCMPVVLSDIPGHSDVPTDPFCLRTRTNLQIAAHYPEFGMISGVQDLVTAEAIAANLSEAIEKQASFAREHLTQELSRIRESIVRQSDFRNSRFAYWKALGDAGAITVCASNSDRVPVGDLIEKAVTPPVDGEALHEPRYRKSNNATNVVIQAHDGGFFSLFNVFMSHVAWWHGRDRSRNLTVVPDWRASTVLGKYSTPTSFCYAGPEDGNSFFRMFELDYVSEDEVEDILGKPHLVAGSMNSRIDPWLTYVHAELNYISAEFRRWRRHVRDNALSRISLVPEVGSIVEEADLSIPSGVRIGMHVRHPSHAIEQRSRKMPEVVDYVRVAHEAIQAHGGDAVVVLATDQESVVNLFKSEFGGHVWCRNGVARVEAEASRSYEGLAAQEKMKEGHQIQHLMAQDHSRWAVQNAVDVLVDVVLLSKCHDFIHVTSNIATAVAAWNPEIDMGLIRPDDTYERILQRRRAISQILI